MSILAGVALGLHLLEALYTFHLTKTRLNMRPTVVFLWTLNVLLAGIFCKCHRRVWLERDQKYFTGVLAGSGPDSWYQGLGRREFQ